MNWLVDLLTDKSTIAYTLLVYSIVIALGVGLGKIKIWGISFGIACVLFVGLGASFLGFEVNHEALHFAKELGLILFVYTIGLQVGPGFFASLRREGLKLNGLAALIVGVGGVLVIALHYMTELPMATLVGIMSGAVTNTPGLGAAQQTLADLAAQNPAIANAPVAAGYALAYPFGVLGIVLTMLILKRILQVNIPAEARLHNKKQVAINPAPSTITLTVKNPMVFGRPVKAIRDILKSNLVVSRIYQNGKISPTTGETILQENDVVLIVANREDFDRLRMVVGEDSKMDLSKTPQQDLVSRRINITRKEAYAKTLAELDVIHRFNVTITRVYRSGIEFIPDGRTHLQFGDTVTVIGDEVHIEALAREFGNSPKRLRTPNVASLFLGIAAGVLLGSIPFNIPGVPVPVKLGLAGGPLVVAILISRYGGNIAFNTYVKPSANLMLRELGIVLFLASVGLSAGTGFVETLVGGDGLYWLLLGALITLIPLLVVAPIARFVFRLNYMELCGLLAGASTDPPALSFANETTGTDAPAVTYAAVYPFTTFLRIMAAQLLILFFM
ncbi:MAG: putative transporter [Bacteroidetes Order II. Incertae sedis bacterium]|nr:putative transporter [Bacteroidetes Order II. bacterium]